MSSRSQLQRALLDAAAVLSSASNIAKRAASLVEVESRTVRSQHSTSQVASAKPIKPSTSQPWPSKALTGSASSSSSVSPSPRPSPSQPTGPVQVLPTEATAILKADGDLPNAAHAHDEEGKGRHVLLGTETASSRTVDDKAVAPVAFKAEEYASVQLDPTATDLPFSSKQEQNARREAAASSSPPPPPPPPLIEDTTAEEYDATKEVRSVPLRAAKVPSSRIARLLHYGSLGAGLAWGAAGSFVRGSGGEGSAEGKQFMSDDNVRRLVDKLSTMRGAALKLGQFMSIQDSNLLPEQIEQVMLRVQNSAHYMPQWQMEKVMKEDLGANWRERFDAFDDVPFAAASIGQVHAATIAKTSVSPLAGQRVAVKVQFPGVRESIGSDLSNLRWLLAASALLPRGLFLDNTIRVMRRELDDECDYAREREMCERFGALLNGRGVFAVPRVVGELCSARVLTCEMMRGRPLTQAARFPQAQRDAIARAILELSLRELFTFRLMQTDPNWTNFLFNECTGKIELIDFGATREYSKPFMDDWLCMLRAAIAGDRPACVRWSEKVGYLTGEEKPSMRDAHVDSMLLLGEPFRKDAPNPYPFAGQTITERVRAHIPIMLRERLTPPPEPTYSLNRKLSGAFLLCARLEAKVGCSELFDAVTKDYRMGPIPVPTGHGGTSVGGAVMSTIRRMHTPSATAARHQGLSRQRLGNLASRWPRHIVEAVASSTLDAAKGDVVTLSGEPRGTSITATRGQKDAVAVDLRAQSVGGQEVRPSDAAENPTTAVDTVQVSSNLADRPTFVRGIAVPKKPTPPGPEDCCMSGCARCVYDLYAEDLQDFQTDLSAARAKLLALAPPLEAAQWNEDILGPRPAQLNGQQAVEAGADGDLRSAEDRAQDEVDAVIGRLDPSMKAFLQLERSLKRKGKREARNEVGASAS